MMDGKKVLIVGVANKDSIAWGIAQTLHEAGAKLAFFCLKSNVRRVTKLASKVDSNIVIPFDATDDKSMETAFKELSDEFDGKLDVLIHSIAYAHIESLGGEFINISREGWELALGVSAYSFVALAKLARPMMIQAGGGSMITMTFGGGEDVVPGYNIMGVAKAALNMSMKYIAYDLGPDNIRVNAISAGPVKTVSSIMVENFEKSLKITEEYSPLQRNIKQEDLGRTALYLVSPLSSGVSGMIIDVDSGMHILRTPGTKHWRAKK